MNRVVAALAGSVMSLVLASEGLAQTRSARPVNIGETLRGELAVGDRRDDWDGSLFDVYSISLASGQCIEVTMESTSFDPFLMVGTLDRRRRYYGEEQDDDGAGDQNAQVRFCAPSRGEYIIRANSYRADTLGAYTLNVRSYEQRTTPRPERAVLGLQPEAMRSLDPQNDARREKFGSRGEQLFDLYEFQAQEGETYVINMRSSQFDPYLEIGFKSTWGGLDEDLILKDNDDGGGQRNARLIFTAPESGEMMIRASGYDKADSGVYYFGADRVPQADALPRRLPKLKNGKTLTGDFSLRSPRLADSLKPQHLYRLEGRRGDSYAITMTSFDFDSVLEILADTPGGMNVIESDNNNGWAFSSSCSPGYTAEKDWRCLSAKVRFTFADRGRVYVRATAAQPLSTGRYELRVEKLQ